MPCFQSSGENINLLLLIIVLRVVFTNILFIKLRKLLSIPTLLGVFIMNGNWILTHIFLYQLIWLDIFLFQSVSMINFTDWFIIIELSSHFRIDCHLIVIHCPTYMLLNQFSNILLRSFAAISLRNIILISFAIFYLVSILRQCSLKKNGLGSIPSVRELIFLFWVFDRIHQWKHLSLILSF